MHQFYTLQALWQFQSQKPGYTPYLKTSHINKSFPTVKHSQLLLSLALHVRKKKKRALARGYDASLMTEQRSACHTKKLISQSRASSPDRSRQCLTALSPPVQGNNKTARGMPDNWVQNSTRIYTFLSNKRAGCCCKLTFSGITNLAPHMYWCAPEIRRVTLFYQKAAILRIQKGRENYY